MQQENGFLAGELCMLEWFWQLYPSTMQCPQWVYSWEGGKLHESELE